MDTEDQIKHNKQLKIKRYERRLFRMNKEQRPCINSYPYLVVKCWFLEILICQLILLPADSLIMRVAALLQYETNTSKPRYSTN